MNSKKIALLLLLLAVSVACKKEVSGMFTAQKDLTFVKKKKELHLAAGKYSAKLKLKSKKKMKLEIKLDEGKIKVEFKIPKGTEIPSTSGTMNLSAAETQQPYDLFASIETETEMSNEIDSTESCTYTTYQRECHRVCDEIVLEDRGGNGGGGRVCHRECTRVPVTHYGSQDVTYYMLYTNQDYNIALFTPGSDEKVASFFGEYNDVDTIYTYKGSCF